MAEGNGIAPSQPNGVGNHHKDEEAQADEPRYSNQYIALCLLGYSLSFIIFGSQVSILGPTINPLAERLGVTEPDLSPLFTALGLACVISGTPSGWLVDRVPTHRVLLGSLSVQAAGFALVPFMPSVWTLTALYFVICFSYNFTNSAVFTSVGWMFPKRAGSALNLVLAMFGVGSFCIPLAAQACKYSLGSALAVFWVVGLTSVVAALPFLFLASPTPPPPVLGTDGPGMFTTTDKALFLERVTTCSVVILVFFTTAAETAIGNWLYTYGVRQEGLSDDEAAFGNSAFWGSFTIGRILGAAVSHLTSPSTLLLTFTPLAMLGASLPLWAGAYLTPWQLIMTTAILTGLGNSTGYANALSLLETYVPMTGLINGIFGMVAGAACMVGPTTVAALAKYTDLKYLSMAWVGGIFYVLHYPTIITAIVSGNKLLALYQSEEQTPEGGDAITGAASGALTEPLLTGQRSGGLGTHIGTSPMAARQPGTRESETGGRLSTSFKPGSFNARHGHTPDGHPRLLTRTSIPGHASPIAVNLG